MSKNYFLHYLSHAPIALARERSLELYLMNSIPSNGKVLDIACGDGFFSSLLFGKEKKAIYGVDLNPNEIERAKFIKTYEEVILMNATNLTYSPESFKVVFSNSSLEHIPNIHGTLKSIRKVLSADGKLYLTLPTNKFEMYSAGATFLNLLKLHKASTWYRKKYNKFWNHYHTYTTKEWISLFNENGFNVVEVIEYATHKFCFINDCLTPLGLIGKINKKIFNRWKIMEPLWALLLNLKHIKEPFNLSQEIGVVNGGLVYFELAKRNEN